MMEAISFIDFKEVLEDGLDLQMENDIKLDWL